MHDVDDPATLTPAQRYLRATLDESPVGTVGIVTGASGAETLTISRPPEFGHRRATRVLRFGVTPIRSSARRQHRGATRAHRARRRSTRSSARSGDSGSDGDGPGEAGHPHSARAAA